MASLIRQDIVDWAAAFLDPPDDLLLAVMVAWAMTSLACFRGVVFGAMSNQTQELVYSLIVLAALVWSSARAIRWVYGRLFPASPEEKRLEEIKLCLETVRRHRTNPIDGADVTDIDTTIKAFEAQASRVKERSKKKED